MDELSRTSLGFLKDLVVMSHLSIIAGSVAMDTLQHEPRPEGEANSTKTLISLAKSQRGFAVVARCAQPRICELSTLHAFNHTKRKQQGTQILIG